MEWNKMKWNSFFVIGMIFFVFTTVLQIINKDDFVIIVNLITAWGFTLSGILLNILDKIEDLHEKKNFN